MTTFYLVRHGQPDWQVTEDRHLIGAQRDFIPLSKEGIAEAEKVATDPRFSQVPFILSSPYTRALQTAAIISRSCNIPLQVEYDLHEWIPDRTLRYDSYATLQTLRKDFYHHRGVHPTGEKAKWEELESVTTRVKKVLDRYTTYPSLIVVCHGTVIQGVTGAAEEVNHCAVTEWTGK